MYRWMNTESFVVIRAKFENNYDQTNRNYVSCILDEYKNVIVSIINHQFTSK